MFFSICQLQEHLIKLQAVLADFHLTHELWCWVPTRLHGLCFGYFTSVKPEFIFGGVFGSARAHWQSDCDSSLFAESKIRITPVWQFLAFDNFDLGTEAKHASTSRLCACKIMTTILPSGDPNTGIAGTAGTAGIAISDNSGQRVTRPDPHLQKGARKR